MVRSQSTPLHTSPAASHILVHLARCAILACLCLSASVARAEFQTAYTGALTRSGGGLVADGTHWAATSGEVILAWLIEKEDTPTEIDPGVFAYQYRYSYYIDVPQTNQPPSRLDHILLTVTPEEFDISSLDESLTTRTFVGDTLFQLTSLGGDPALRLYRDDASDPFSSPVVFSFTSFNAPEWGDFYGGGQGANNAFWNSGLNSLDPNADVISFSSVTPLNINFEDGNGPMTVYANQMVAGVYKILRPDGLNFAPHGQPPVVPEPSFWAALIGMGATGGLLGLFRRRKAVSC